MSHDITETICKQLGIPQRIFLWDTDQARLSHAAEYVLHEEARLAWVRKYMTNKVVAPMLEKNFPEMFWELAFTFSHANVYKRRTPPTITWSE
jgi:hypothetical protein